MDALVLKCEDWEMLYINGKHVDSGHTLEEGYERLTYFLNKSDEYGFNLKDVRFMYLTSEDEEQVNAYGDGPTLLSELKGNYEK